VNRFQTELSKPSIDSLTPGNHKVKLAWSYLDTINISHYNIYRYNIASNKFDSLKSTINNKTFSHVDSGLINDVDYRYIITAVNINSIESDNSNESSAIPFNKKPKAIQLNDKIVNNAGRNISTSLQFSSIGSIDEDGIIDSVVWYVNNKRVSNSINLNYGFRQGTSKVLMKIYDNDMAQDSSIAYVTISTFKKKMNGPVFAGLSAVNDNLIYAADYSYINGLGAKTIQIDSTGKTNFDLIVTQQIRTTPSVTNDSSVLITNGSLLNGFTKTGNPLFGSISLGGISEVTPTIDSTLERIYVGVSNRKFFAFNYKVGGQIAWDYISDAPIVSSAVITADRKLIFADQIGNIYGFDILTTNSQGIIPKWKYNLNDSINTSPAVDNNGNIVVGSVSGKLYKLTLNNNGTVTILWSTIISNKITSSPIIDGNGFIYVGSLDGKLTKVNSNNGSIVWDYNSGAEIRSTPSMSNTGIIYFGNENGMLTAIDTTGRLYWYYKDSSSISANILHINGTTYIGTHNGNVLAFWDKGLTTYGKGISSKITEPQWGTYQGNSRRTGIQNNILSVGVNNTLLKNNIKIYPNPTHDKIMIEIELKQINEIIEVYDLTGKLVLKEIISGNSEIDLSSFNSGVYIIKIKDTYTRVIKI
jgi:outer membrane protein assembly factor BamB